MRILQGGLLLASGAALLLTAACGSSSGDKAAASPSGSASSSGFAAYAACLKQHGVNIPTARPSGRPSGGGRGFFGGGNQQAVQACRSLAPQGGRFGGQGMQELQAYRSCLSDHGVKLPTPTPGAQRTPGAERTPGARRSPGAGFLGGLNTTDPKVAKAVKTCKPLLPTFSPRPSPS
ncbi:hypothetical protein [Actinoallomurus acaciae]|uniref:Uncharacterized protein n=1 Tax=Actinoallomurus acaciae TaxID=502577 RepID=A0ABV5YXI3_9ACTN